MQGLGQVGPFAVQRMGMFAASWAGYCELLGSNSVFPWRVRLQETVKHQEVLLSWNQICLSDRVRHVLASSPGLSFSGMCVLLLLLRNCSSHSTCTRRGQVITGQKLASKERGCSKGIFWMRTVGVNVRPS